MGPFCLYNQLHIYRRAFTINGYQKLWCRPEKYQKNTPRMWHFNVPIAKLYKIDPEELVRSVIED